MKYKLYIIVVLMIVLIGVSFAVFGQKPESEACREFLAGYGWEIEDGIYSASEIYIPDPPDNMFESYNALQHQAGLDLSSSRGRKGMRYTFTVSNYPTDVGETVYANVICIDGIPIAGDIMTASLNGFMHSLRLPDSSQDTQ